MNMMGSECVDVLQDLLRKRYLHAVLEKCATDSSYLPLFVEIRSKYKLPKNWTDLISLGDTLLRLEEDERNYRSTLSTHNSRESAIFKSQARLRENIKAMEHSPKSKLMDRYMKDLDREEDELLETRKAIEALDATFIRIKSDRDSTRATLRTLAKSILEGPMQ